MSESELSFLDHLVQPYPIVSPWSIFPSIDYVLNPFVDYIDAVGTIFILWTVSSIFSRLIPLTYGRSTRSLAVKTVYNRVIALDTSSFYHRKKDSQNRIRNKFKSNPQLRLFAFGLLLCFIIVEIAIIYSQTYKTVSRSLDELQLKSYSFDIPRNEDIYYSSFFRTGCSSLVEPEAFNSKIAFQLCFSDKSEYSYRIFNMSVSTVEIFVTESGFRLYRSLPNTTFQNRALVETITFELNSYENAIFFNLNFSVLDFAITPTKLNWLIQFLDLECPECQHRYQISNSSHAILDANYVNNSATMNIARGVRSMIGLSNKTLSRDFFSTPISSDSGENLFNNLSESQVKRISGLIIWIAVAVLFVLDFMLSCFTADLEQLVDTMIFESLYAKKKASKEEISEGNLVDSMSGPINVSREMYQDILNSPQSSNNASSILYSGLLSMKASDDKILYDLYEEKDEEVYKLHLP